MLFNNAISVWDVQTGSFVGTPTQLEEVHDGSFIRNAELSPTGTHVVGGMEGITCVWDTQTGALVLGPLKENDSDTSDLWGKYGYPIPAYAFSPDGALIASGCQCLHIWDVHTGALVLRILKPHTAAISTLSYSPDGTLLASGSKDNTICVWDPQKGHLIAGPLAGHSGDQINSIQFLSDATHIVSNAQDGTIRVWDIQTGPVAPGLLTHQSEANSSVSWFSGQ
jgi:WD40 repeat protein